MGFLNLGSSILLETHTQTLWLKLASINAVTVNPTLTDAAPLFGGGSAGAGSVLAGGGSSAPPSAFGAGFAAGFLGPYSLPQSAVMLSISSCATSFTPTAL